MLITKKVSNSKSLFKIDKNPETIINSIQDLIIDKVKKPKKVILADSPEKLPCGKHNNILIEFKCEV